MYLSIEECKELLELNDDYSLDELKTAYRLMHKKYHPDLHPDDEVALEIDKKVNYAFEKLHALLLITMKAKENRVENVGHSDEKISGDDLDKKREDFNHQVDKLISTYESMDDYSLLKGQIEGIKKDYLRKGKTVRFDIYYKYLIRIKIEIDELFELHKSNASIYERIMSIINTLPRDLFDLFRKNMTKKEMSEYTHLPVEVINMYYILKDYKIDYSEKSVIQVYDYLSFYEEQLKSFGLEAHLQNSCK